MRRRGGFTIIEALVSVLLAGTGIVGCYAALGALAKAETMSTEIESMQRLGLHKLDELEVTGDFTSSDSGDFSDQNNTTYEWQTTITSSGVNNLNDIVMVVRRKNSSTGPEATLETLRYAPPTTTTSTTTTP